MEIEKLAKPVLGVYRRMLTLARRLPAADAADATRQIREAFRANKDERSEERCGPAGVGWRGSGSENVKNAKSG